MPTSYAVKIINPNNAGGEIIIDDFEIEEKYLSVEMFKTMLCEKFSQYAEDSETHLGYITPGHRMKGKLTLMKSLQLCMRNTRKRSISCCGYVKTESKFKL